jgi:hypothetical protein
MSGEDDTFDIDIYGDETNEQQEPSRQMHQEQNPEDRLFDDDDVEYDAPSSHEQNGAGSNNSNNQAHQDNTMAGSTQGTKRKADEIEIDDFQQQQQQNAQQAEQQPSQPPQQQQQQMPSGPSNSTPRPASTAPVDPNATSALKLLDMQWWITEEHIREFCRRAKVEHEVRDLAFGEHKINGKSRGEAYLELNSVQSAAAVKRAVEERHAPVAGETEGRRKNQVQCWYCPIGNPFKGRDSGQATKKDAGAYNAAPARGGFNRGGGFPNRGAGFQARGGGFQGRGGYQNPTPQPPAWGMNTNMGAGYTNPMMAMGGMNNMAMGGFNNMAGMMGGRGNFGGGMGGMNNMMNMGARGNMMGARGGMMNNRGGWGGNFGAGGGMQPGGYGGNPGYGMGQPGGMQNGPNKKMRGD